MSSFLIFSSLEIPAIFCSQLISVLSILFSSVHFAHRKMGCIIALHILVLVFFLISPYPVNFLKMLVRCIQFSFVGIFVVATYGYYPFKIDEFIHWFNCIFWTLILIGVSGF